MFPLSLAISLCCHLNLSLRYLPGHTLVQWRPHYKLCRHWLDPQTLSGPRRTWQQVRLHRERAHCLCTGVGASRGTTADVTETGQKSGVLDDGPATIIVVTTPRNELSCDTSLLSEQRVHGKNKRVHVCADTRPRAHTYTHTHTKMHTSTHAHTAQLCQQGESLPKHVWYAIGPPTCTHTHTDTRRHSHRTNSSSAPSGPHLTRWGDGRPKLVSALHLKPFLMPAVPGWGNQRQVLKRGGLSLCRTLKYLTSCESQH